MVALIPYDGRTIAVLGLGKSGLAAARALAGAGADVWAWDDDPAKRQVAAEEGLKLVDLLACDWQRPESLVLSPGIPHTWPRPHPAATLARAAGCEIIGDIELLVRNRPDATFVGVTGTNGKSTTTTLIGHILKWAGRQVEVGGNLGTPALSLTAVDPGGIYLLEMSSYQLELTPSIRFAVAVLLNITPDHLGRHGGMDGYLAAKRRIFAGQGADDTAIIGVDDTLCRITKAILVAERHQRVVPISSESAIPRGVYVVDGMMVDDIANRSHKVIDLRRVATLPGAHNWQNAAAAYAACRALGLESEAIATGLKSYPGLAHRQELIATIDGIRFINDSKATNADATAKALACYDAIYLILGGRPKETGLAGLQRYYDRIVHAFLIGEATESFAATLAGRVPATPCQTLSAAVSAAAAMARQERRPDAVVLLSPAAASFDQFANFEERGESFRRSVKGLSGAVSGGPDPRQANLVLS
jgi:UDP-N-acetylmuramoylalanine--D-glutamate ligase